jgi:2-hydroxychromene-2-carboxylate isomerase
MNDAVIAAQVIHRAGFDAQALIALASEQSTKDALKAATQAAVNRGIFGAPTFFVGEQMFWGQDRMDFVKEALQ